MKKETKAKILTIPIVVLLTLAAWKIPLWFIPILEKITEKEHIWISSFLFLTCCLLLTVLIFRIVYDLILNSLKDKEE